MSDHLIWRLRNNDTAKHLCGLAADEIERLKVELREERVAVLELQQEACNRAGVPMPSQRPVVDRLREVLARIHEVARADNKRDANSYSVGDFADDMDIIFGLTSSVLYPTDGTSRPTTKGQDPQPSKLRSKG